MPSPRKKESPLVLVTALLFLILVALVILGGLLRAPWYVQHLEPFVKPLAQKVLGPNPEAAADAAPVETPATAEPEPTPATDSAVATTTSVAPAAEPDNSVPPVEEIPADSAPTTMPTPEEVVTVAPVAPVVPVAPVAPAKPVTPAAKPVTATPPPAPVTTAAAPPQISMPATVPTTAPQAATEEDAGIADMLAKTIGTVGAEMNPGVAGENSEEEAAKTTAVATAVKVDTEKRPRPADLNFKKIQGQVDAYVNALDDRARKRELSRINMISQLRNEWMHSKIGYDANNNGIRLKSGRTVRGMLMVNENQMVMMMRNSSRPLTIQWDDIGADQYITFLEDHVRQKTSRMGRNTPPDFALMVGNDCFRLAVLLDWYQHSAEAAKYAKDAVRYNPELEGPVSGYFSAGQ